MTVGVQDAEAEFSGGAALGLLGGSVIIEGLGDRSIGPAGKGLFAVVGGLVGVPVIAVPTSVGYGAAFQGVAPLLTMLNACAANVVVVNIDSGFKAGYVAALIARRAAMHQEPTR